MPTFKKVYLSMRFTGKTGKEVRANQREIYSEFDQHVIHGSDIALTSAMRGKEAVLVDDMTINGSHGFSPRAIAARDFDDVKTSDIVLVDARDGVSHGQIAEMAFAYALQKPVILLCNPELPPETYVHPFIEGLATAVCWTLEEAVGATVDWVDVEDMTWKARSCSQ